MNNKYYYMYIIILIILISCNQSVEISQWRGPNRDGIYPVTNLLKQWPVNGPEMIWSYEGLGEGHGNVGIGKDQLYICGMPDTIGVLFSFNKEGKLLWKKEYGLEWYRNYTGSRSTPTVVDELVYFESGQGVVYCYDGNTGDQIWSVDLLRKFDAQNIEWGMAESLLIDGDIVFCTPGGKKNNIVALNRFNGETVWISPGNGKPSAYCSPILVNHNGTRLIITNTAGSVIGVDAETGEFYWSIEMRQQYQIHANTPVYHKGRILCSTAEDKSDLDGSAQIQLSMDGKKAEVAWRNVSVKNLMNGYILKNGFVYGSPFNRSEWYCVNWKTGDIKYISKAFKSGAVIYADGLFYCYSHTGEMGLVDANPNEFKVISSFRVPLGTKQHWAHPVINNGRLYVRHGNALMVYDISEK
jgi:outer membrane protein assembly factor BamB